MIPFSFRARTLAAALLGALIVPGGSVRAAERPNIFLAIADDWGWPHAGVYGDPVVKTPTFDRLAREGVLFTHAFVSAPSCTPSRGALLTGQYHWRLEEGANLWSTLPEKFRSYPEVLREAGYVIGHSRKAWGPGRIGVGGRKEDPAGPRLANFAEFLKARPKGKPFCYWFGSSDPHRPYEPRSGAKSGMDLKKIKLPGCFPDHEIVRSDIADYYWEVQRFDREAGEALALLEQTGELENTIIVMTGDHGMPFPRGKSNLYDLGAHVPLAVRWGAKARAGRTVQDFVSFVDLAPTFLEAAALKPLAEMTGRSLVGVLQAGQTGTVDARRDHVIYGKERHVPSQEKGNLSGYPCRALRTKEFLYIHNFRPELGPAGIADGAQAHIGNSFADCDNGPTKSFLLEHHADPKVKKYFDLAFAKRPVEELYDLQKDPEQLTNVAGRPEYATAQKRLGDQLLAELRATGDPRVLGGAEKFDAYPYYGGPQKPPTAP
ncbi:MAG: sulfatase [Verrucomicrobia bacterium]|nr:sulfatase [Verrucomicrobiota bacterium]